MERRNGATLPMQSLAPYGDAAIANAKPRVNEETGRRHWMASHFAVAEARDRPSALIIPRLCGAYRRPNKTRHVPLIGEGNQTAWAHRLSFTAAARYEDYSDVGEADTYKFGAIYAPVEGLNLRGTIGTSFRAPSLFQLDGLAGVVFNFERLETFRFRRNA